MISAALPPEVTSARMYAGPGSGSMVAGAAAWSRLAADMGSLARGYESVISGLAGAGWSGPASEAMAAAAEPYAAWMTVTAASLEQAAARLGAAVSAFEEAHAAVVPPPVIAANRSESAALAATNTLGQNSARIAALEAEYGQMWGTNTVAMQVYSARSAAAAAVTPFTDPPPTTSPGGLGAQSAATANAAAGGANSQLTQLMSQISQALNGLGSSPAMPGSPLAGMAEPLQSVSLPSASNIAAPVEALARSILVANDANVSVLYGQGQFARNLNFDLDAAEARAAAATPSVSAAGAEPPLSAGLGKAATIGKLAVPTTWMESAPVARMTVSALPGAGSGAAAVAATAPGGLFADMALAGLAGRAIAGTAGGVRPAATDDAHSRSQLERLADELTGTPEVQHWHADSAQPESLFTELVKKPGVHTVHLDRDRGAEPEPPQQGRG